MIIMKYKFQLLTILAFGLNFCPLKTRYILVKLNGSENEGNTSVQARNDGELSARGYCESGGCVCPWRPGPPTCTVACCPRVVPIPEGFEGKFDSLGCWNDKYPYRALEDSEKTVKQLYPQEKDWGYKYREQAVGKCYDAARTLGRKNFAVQDGGQCFTEGPFKPNEWRGNFQVYGPSDKCESDGKGGPMANEVYGRLDGGVSCFKDGDCRPGKYCNSRLGFCQDPNIVPTIPPPEDKPQIKEFGSFRWLVLDYKVVHQLKGKSGNEIRHFCHYGEDRTRWVLLCEETIGRLLDILSLNVIGPFVYVIDPSSINPLTLGHQWIDSLKSCLPDAMVQCGDWVVTCESYWNAGVDTARAEYRERLEFLL